MPIATWQPGTLYLEGSLVIPTTSEPGASTAIPNAGFESGDSGWTKGAGWAINQVSAFAGTWSAQYSGPGVALLESTTKHAVEPGTSITASCFIQHGASDDGEANGAVILRWYTSGDVLVSTSTGNIISTGAAGVWKKSEVTGIAPATAAKVAIGCTSNNDFEPLYADNFQWNFVAGAAAAPLSYKAIQSGAGTSGESEPVWPSTPAATVVDGTVTWEAVTVDSITWEASSILTSGSSEPTWPTGSGDYVSDNNIAWLTSPLRIDDENCPHTKVVAIAASKVFAGDVDVVRFCATLNARDWSSEDDAGFLPTGLQQKSQVGVSAMGVYRANLAVWSPSTFQVWQVDPDPAAMALLDAMEGIGSIHQQAVQPVSDDLFFLAALGVRTVSIAEGSNNLASGDVGVPIDILVQAEANAVDVEPVASYYPGAGQFWLAFRPLSVGAALLAGQFLLSSPPYPIEAIDDLAFTAGFNGGYTQGVNNESVDFSASHLNSFIDNVFLESAPQPESVDFTASHLDSFLDDIFLESEAQPESVDFSASHLDSTIEFALVRHTNPAESLDWEVEWTGGSA